VGSRRFGRGSFVRGGRWWRRRTDRAWVEFPIVDSITEGLRLIFEFHAMLLDERLVRAERITEIELAVGIENLMPHFPQFGILAFASFEQRSSICDIGLKLLALGIALLCTACRLRQRVLGLCQVLL